LIYYSSPFSRIDKQYQRIDQSSPPHTAELHNFQTTWEDPPGEQLERTKYATHVEAAIRVTEIVFGEAA
jgi:hypothetical protein